MNQGSLLAGEPLKASLLFFFGAAALHLHM
ncbi:hypothetical protein SAMN05518847_11363 [Paenibacillus sp. OV219]|nr:hypothetical protein SAMN05518847_11363 [Paenibacillus sp. OV219]